MKIIVPDSAQHRAGYGESSIFAFQFSRLSGGCNDGRASRAANYVLTQISKNRLVYLNGLISMQRLDEQFTSTLPLIQRLGFSGSAFDFAMRYHMHVLLLVMIAVFTDGYEREQTRGRFAPLLLLVHGGMMKKMIRVGLLLLVIPALSGCWLLAAGGAGAYGGYKMKEEGYTLQNPVKKEAPAESTK